MCKFYVCALHPFVCFVFKFILLIPSVYVDCRITFLMVNNFFGDDKNFKVDYIYNTFGKGACMDSYLMDFVINYWEQDPEMSLVYHPGERVLLSPLFMTINVSALMYFLLWCIFSLVPIFYVHSCMLILFHAPFVLFLCSMFFKWKSL